ncbi:MAG: substrate binding domain-containing protein [Gammaproteobacteria bacterium]
MRDSSLVARKIADFERGLYASPSYIKRWGPVHSPSELPRHRGMGFLRYEQPGQWQLSRGAQTESVDIPTPLLSDDVEALVMAAEAGAGIVVATDWLVSKQVRAGRLVLVLPEWRVGKPSAVYAVTPSLRLLPSKTKVFLDWLISRLRGASPARS